MLPLLVQFAASLAAILALAGAARWMGLGQDVRLRDESHARQLANAAVSDFEAASLTLDRARTGALLRDGNGRVMLLRRHGAHFAARLLDNHAFARLDRNFLTIGTGETAFGSVTLDLGDQAQVWASSFRRLEGRLP
ncbi:MAG: hypothetical protein J0M19_08270 [Sphingomonadales bacterium]|nr:hypothetical protein [Sphingomonadales bacterium]